MVSPTRTSGSDVVTSPAFVECHGRIVHFFGTRFEPRVLRSIAQVGAVIPGPPPFSQIAVLRQVHGQTVIVLDGTVEGDVRVLEPGDALVTNRTNLVLIVRTADCAPVLLADKEGRAVAAIHAGWRGAIGGIVARTVKLMGERFGCRAIQLCAAVGPSIGGCCYEVDETVLGPLRERCSFWTAVAKPGVNGKAFLDLKELVVCQLVDCGVPRSAISRADHCTRCEPDLFFSYRRDGPRYSTMVNGIMLRESRTP